MNHFEHFVHFDFIRPPVKMNHFDHFVHFDFIRPPVKMNNFEKFLNKNNKMINVVKIVLSFLDPK